ncbi:Fur family transcriptional regulator [Halobacteriovorax sp. GFR7]|uniref:Fur family transcriptional regulator n=1 Tax=unclassified Halobacteriovorax TaxID=2639665 RepID=UPI00371CA03E
MSRVEDLLEILKSHGLRITQARQGVVAVLIVNEDSPLTPEEIYQSIVSSKEFKCDQASVYRTLTSFEELGIVKKSIFQGEAARYSLCGCAEHGEDHGHHHHHHEHYFKCNKCNKIEPLDGCFLSSKEEEMKKDGYTGLKHHIEITGICPKCS